MTREEIEEIIQQTKAEFLNEEVVKESDLETTQEQSYAKGWNACNHRWTQTLKECLSKLQVEPCEDTISRADAIRVASGYCHPANIAKELAKLPPVTPIRPKGHWIEEFNDLEGEVRFTCSSCRKYQLFETDFCYHCGVRMVEPQERNDKE